MRIISGKHKGKRIIAPKNLPVRPTADMQKEALFNILNNYYDFNSVKILDLFSGTGNIAYEFASRGTNDITTVDENFLCVNFIRKTANEFEFPIDTVKSDVFKFLEKTAQQFDMIFADPPYQMDETLFYKIVEIVFEKKLLSKIGMLIIEHSKFTNFEKIPHFSFSRSYGGSVFSFFEIK